MLNMLVGGWGYTKTLGTLSNDDGDAKDDA